MDLRGVVLGLPQCSERGRDLAFDPAPNFRRGRLHLFDGKVKLVIGTFFLVMAFDRPLILYYCTTDLRSFIDANQSIDGCEIAGQSGGGGQRSAGRD